MSFYYQALDDIDEYNQEFLAQLNHADEKIRFVALPATFFFLSICHITSITL